MAQPQTVQEAASERFVVSFTPTEKSKLLAQAKVKGLRLATYVRSLVVQCIGQQEKRSSGAGNR